MSLADVKNRRNNGETMSRDPKSAQSGPSTDTASRGGEADGDRNGPETRNDPGGGSESRAGVDAGAEEAGSDPAADTAAGAGGEDGPVDAEAESPAAELEAVKAELADQKDQYLRAAAEVENIRRRANNDIANARKFAVEGFAKEVLAVRDSLEIARSLEINEDDEGAVAKMKEGLELTLKQLDSALAKFSIAVVEPEQGDKLDPDRHQAMSTQESDNVPPNHIVAVIQKGYTIHERLLRPAMVVVAKKPQDQTQAEGEPA